MVKNATTWKAGVTAPAKFCISLLVSSAVVNCLPLAAIASEVVPLHPNEVQNTTASASVQQTASVEASAEVPIHQDVTSVAELTSNQRNTDTNPVQTPVAIPPTTTAQTTPVETSAEPPTLGDVTAATELSQDSDAN